MSEFGPCLNAVVDSSSHEALLKVRMYASDRVLAALQHGGRSIHQPSLTPAALGQPSFLFDRPLFLLRLLYEVLVGVDLNNIL